MENIMKKKVSNFVINKVRKKANVKKKSFINTQNEDIYKAA